MQGRSWPVHLAITFMLAMVGAFLLGYTYLMILPQGLPAKDGAHGLSPLQIIQEPLAVVGTGIASVIAGLVTWPLYAFYLKGRPIRISFLLVWVGIGLSMLLLTPLHPALGFIFSFVALALGMNFYAQYGPRFSDREGLCPGCGYDVSSHVPRDGKCPECGFVLTDVASKNKQPTT